MRTNIRSVAMAWLSVASLGVAACQKASPPENTPAAQMPPAAPAAQAADAVAPAAEQAIAQAEGESHVHKVACGCALGGKCANMIEVEGAYVPLKSETVAIGDMAFCGKTGLRAEVTGAMQDGTFVATSYKLLAPEGEAPQE